MEEVDLRPHLLQLALRPHLRIWPYTRLTLHFTIGSPLAVALANIAF